MNSSKNDKERQHFDDLAKEIGESWWGIKTPAGQKRFQRRASIIADYVKSLNAAKILEIGCGTGPLTKHILDHSCFSELICCDISPYSIEIASKQARPSQSQQVSFLIADVEDLPFPSEKFDVIVGNSILHHVNVDVVLKECYRLLKPEGIIVFFEPNMLNPQIAIEKNVKWIGRMLQNTSDETAFTRWGMEKILRTAEFKNIDVQPYDFLHPGTPEKLIPLMERLTFALEKIWFLKEIAGSLKIYACK